MCGGASKEQKQISSEQNAYYAVMTQQAQAEFGMASGIFNMLKGTFGPILQAGPNQQGFSKPELDTLNAQAINQTGANYAKAARAVNESLAAQGGGNVKIDSGVNEEIKAQVAESAAETSSKEELGIQQANFDTGRQNFLTAAQVLSGAPNVFNPANSGSVAATDAGSAASKTAADITAANNSWMQMVTGAVGGVAGGWAAGGFKTPGSSGSA